MTAPTVPVPRDVKVRSRFTNKKEESGSGKPLSGWLDQQHIFVDLSDRGLKEFQLQEQMLALNSLTHLYLNNNAIPALSDELFQINSLKWLDVRCNRLKTFPTAVKSHPSLETILLDDNEIVYLPIELGSLENLIGLSVSGNPLKFPSQSVLRECRHDRNLIKYMKKCWELKSTGVLWETVLKELKRRKSHRERRSFGRFRDLTEVVCEKKKSSDTSDQIEADQIAHQIQRIQRQLQRLKDLDALRSWRDRYRCGKRHDILAVVQPPPFDIDEDYKRMLNRHELTKPEPKKVIRPGKKINFQAEVSELEQRLSKISGKEHGDDPEKAMAARLKEIQALRDIQKKIEALKTQC